MLGESLAVGNRHHVGQPRFPGSRCSAATYPGFARAILREAATADET